GVVIDALLRAVGAGERHLLVGRGAGDDARAHLAADLDGGEPDAAGSAEHRQRLARLHLRAVLERMVGGAVGDGERRRALEVETGGDLDQMAGAYRDPLGRGAEIAV